MSIDERYLWSYDLDEMAKKAAGNWKSFNSFGWGDRPDDADDRMIVYTHNRDSDNRAVSNASVIKKELQLYIENGDVIPEHHRHWAVGWVDGYAILVLRNGKPTDAFKKWLELQARIEEYPILDEEDYSKRNYDDTCENIDTECYGMIRENLPEDWKAQVYDWLWKHDQSAITETSEDGVGWPRKKSLLPALTALGFLDPDYED